MKLRASIVFTCFLSLCWAEEQISEPSAKPPSIPPLEKKDSPVSLLKQNSDGTLLVSLKPQIYLDARGCVMISDGHGNTFSQMFYMIAFSLKDVRYQTIWGVTLGAGPPVKLDPTIDYKCLIEPEKPKEAEANLSFTILKIWKDEELLYDYEKKKTGE